MTNLSLLVVLLAVACFPATRSPAADAPQTLIRVEAVVEKYEIAAMEDAFDDGRFVTYDGVTLKLLSPEEVAPKSIRVYFRSGSIAENSPLRTAGQHCRFDFDKNLLKADQMFRGALNSFQLIDVNGEPEGGDLEKKSRPVDPDVLAAIEKELSRLDEHRKSETGPNLPRPSTQIAYYLLAGLAEQGVWLADLAEDEQGLFDIEKRGGRSSRLMSVFTDVRVALIDYVIQDKSGTYIRKTAVLYVHQEGQWTRKGNGETIVAAD